MTGFDQNVSHLAETVLEKARAQGLKIATAESCTGGLIAAALTEIAGSSDVVDRGFVTYSNEAKAEMIDVPPKMIAAHGAVSEPVARAMADGAVKNSRADIAVAVTGVAGPGGGSAQKPVGLVHFGLSRLGQANLHEHHVFSGDRAAVRQATVETALRLVLRNLEESA